MVDESIRSAEIVRRSAPRTLLILLALVVAATFGGLGVVAMQTAEKNQNLEEALREADRRIERLETERRRPLMDPVENNAIDQARSVALPLPDSEHLTRGVLTVLVTDNVEEPLSFLLTGEGGIQSLKYRLSAGSCSGRSRGSDLSVTQAGPDGTVRLATTALDGKVIDDTYWVEARAGSVPLGSVVDPLHNPTFLAPGSDPCEAA